MTDRRGDPGIGISAASALGWNNVQGAGRPARWRGVVERIVARGYGAAYDGIVRGFPPYESLLDDIAAFVARSRRDRPGGPPLRVLDVTSGTGTVANRLARDGHVVVGLEPVEHLVDVARRRHGGDAAGNPTFLHLDVARDAVPGAGTFDVVVSVHTLYWHPDAHALLEGCRRVLRPDGRGVFLTYTRPARIAPTFARMYTAQGLRAAIRGLRWLIPTAIFEGLRQYTPRYLSEAEFHAALRRAGFEVVESHRTFLADLSVLAWARVQPPAEASRPRR